MLIFISIKQLDNELKISIKKVNMNNIIFGTTKVDFVTVDGIIK